MTALPTDEVVFSRPAKFPAEMRNLEKVINSGFVHGDGAFTASATAKLASITGSKNALLTTSGTHSLEMSARLLGLGIGDEVIIPSFTFSSGAASIVATGATPVFVDIDGSSGNLSIGAVENALTPHTRAISVMHYGGQPVDMARILEIATQNNLKIIEDNAHGLGVETELGVLGSIGDVGIQSFHDTKNVHCGEGGAILIRDSALMDSAEIMREKGTNRANFLRGQVDKYTWVDWGSSYLPSELNAAVLDAQLDHFSEIQDSRFRSWDFYKLELEYWAKQKNVELMSPRDGIHAAHVFFMLMPSAKIRNDVLAQLREHGVIATFHYVPLHSSPAGQKYGRAVGDMSQTDDFASRLIRLPLFTGMKDAELARVVDAVTNLRF